MLKQFVFSQPTCRSGGTGRRAGFKIQWWQHRVGSSPTFGTFETKPLKS